MSQERRQTWATGFLVLAAAFAAGFGADALGAVYGQYGAGRAIKGGSLILAAAAFLCTAAVLWCRPPGRDEP